MHDEKNSLVSRTLRKQHVANMIFPPHTRDKYIQCRCNLPSWSRGGCKQTLNTTPPTSSRLQPLHHSLPLPCLFSDGYTTPTGAEVMGLHHHRRRVFVDSAHLGALVQLSHHEGRAGSGVAQQRQTDVLLAYRILQPAGNTEAKTRVMRCRSTSVQRSILRQVRSCPLPLSTKAASLGAFTANTGRPCHLPGIHERLTETRRLWLASSTSWYIRVGEIWECTLERTLHSKKPVAVGAMHTIG